MKSADTVDTVALDGVPLCTREYISVCIYYRAIIICVSVDEGLKITVFIEPRRQPPRELPVFRAPTSKDRAPKSAVTVRVLDCVIGMHACIQVCGGYMELSEPMRC